MNLNKVIINYRFEQGELASYGISDILTESIAKLLMLDILYQTTVRPRIGLGGCAAQKPQLERPAAVALSRLE